ncbi:MAG: hypothetical protein HUU49_00530 [Candidatus Buchananbacteria bacterium]|nr:hypothetical protein [Candidatus Buchananbacteria bacterium]
MNKRVVLVAIGGVFLLAALAFGSKFFGKNDQIPLLDNSAPVIVDANSADETSAKPDDYQANVQQTLKQYWQTGESAGIKDRLLAFTTPSDFLDLHLDLVIAFELIEQGQSGNDQEKIAGAKAKLEALKTQYPWIANY